jgi:hypothetical protein
MPNFLMISSAETFPEDQKTAAYRPIYVGADGKG